MRYLVKVNIPALVDVSASTWSAARRAAIGHVTDNTQNGAAIRAGLDRLQQDGFRYAEDFAEIVDEYEIPLAKC